jgi:HlyD family secretion protein
MKKVKWIIAIILIVIVIFYVVFDKKMNVSNLEYTYTNIEKGTIELSVLSTGSLEAINTVEIGTQISGTVKEIYVDYNDKVKAGQLLAEMDLKLLNTSLMSAQANLNLNKTKFNQAKEEFERAEFLFEEKVISQQQFSNAKYNFEQAKSAMEIALATVNNINVSISYAHIISPINGTITERSVEEGQTVAAAFSTPKMFIIAEDLSKMQILADVDEGDIGYISNGMKVKFKVQTYPEMNFYGVVSQIRLQPIEINNVVNYQVVISVDNKEGLLLPGMTTNIEFIMKSANNVLILNNSALRFKPNDVMLKELKIAFEKTAKNLLPDSIQQKFIEGIHDDDKYTSENFKKAFPTTIDVLFYKNSGDKLAFKFIEIGIKTGLKSEIKNFMGGEFLPENTKVINGIKAKN